MMPVLELNFLLIISPTLYKKHPTSVLPLESQLHTDSRIVSELEIDRAEAVGLREPTSAAAVAAATSSAAVAVTTSAAAVAATTSAAAVAAATSTAAVAATTSAAAVAAATSTAAVAAATSSAAVAVTTSAAAVAATTSAAAVAATTSAAAVAAATSTAAVAAATSAAAVAAATSAAAVAGATSFAARAAVPRAHTCNGDRGVFCHICGEFELRKNQRSITKDNRISYKECYGFAMSVMAWSPDSLCSKCRVMLFQSCEFVKRDWLRIASPGLWRKPSTREDCHFCMTDVQGISAETKCRIKNATVPTMTVPVLSPNLHQKAPILIVSDVESGSWKVSQSENKEGVETDDAEGVGHGIEEDRNEQEAEVQDDASDETSSNETSAEEESEEYISAGGNCVEWDLDSCDSGSTSGAILVHLG
ncbi:hypothetical protein QAD02_013766 [Eretmocerus hayati]|uniref:Uncharacterized protein n=1 Tax=Eretmocerus hayati TaxID=131215 RepID=A0ACC2P321_9HYME|nr:hypothetical protein QAD02_013766 [Eretmocerus hayati]